MSLSPKFLSPWNCHWIFFSLPVLLSFYLSLGILLHAHLSPLSSHEIALTFLLSFWLLSPRHTLLFLLLGKLICNSLSFPKFHTNISPNLVKQQSFRGISSTFLFCLPERVVFFLLHNPPSFV